jgi:two-component sensor histidine kinase
MSSELRPFDLGISAGPDARLSEAHHRIANNLALVAGFVRLQATALMRRAKALPAADVAMAMEEVGARIETIGRLHRLLSRDPQSEIVDVGEYLRDTCEALSASMSFGGDMAISFQCPGLCEAPADQAGPLALIVTELVTNAIKYAHPAGVPGRVDVRCRNSIDGSLNVTVTDDGVGLPEGFDPQSDGGLGMRVVRSLALQLRGNLSFVSHGVGMTVRLCVPAAAAPLGK